MALGRYRKTPTERKRYSIDYYDWLDSGETIFGVNFQVFPANEMVIDASSIDPDGSRLVFFVNGGVDQTLYTVEVQMTTTGGQIKEDEVLFEVEDFDDVLVVSPVAGMT